MKIVKPLFVSLALCLVSLSLSAQDYSISLEGITKVVVSAETNISIKSHDKAILLLRESENFRNVISEKTKGLKSIGTRGTDNTNFGVEVKKEGTLLIVNGVRDRIESNLIIHLPKNMNISVESLANNDIYIDGFDSEIEAINHLGEIRLTNLTGPIVAENNNGNVTAEFSELNQSSPTSIIASNGEIDIKLPATTPANITSKILRGDLYTDFDFSQREENSTRRGTRSIIGELNNGGVNIFLQNLKGNIYIRKL